MKPEQWPRQRKIGLQCIRRMYNNFYKPFVLKQTILSGYQNYMDKDNDVLKKERKISLFTDFYIKTVGLFS